MTCPDSFDDDQQGYYLEQAQAMLATGMGEMLTEDHKQALQAEEDNETK